MLLVFLHVLERDSTFSLSCHVYQFRLGIDAVTSYSAFS